MKPRIAARRVNPKVRQHMLAINGHLHHSSLGSRLLHLLELRASQIRWRVCYAHAALWIPSVYVCAAPALTGDADRELPACRSD